MNDENDAAYAKGHGHGYLAGRAFERTIVYEQCAKLCEVEANRYPTLSIAAMRCAEMIRAAAKEKS